MAPRFELRMGALQAPALPLGYATRTEPFYPQTGEGVKLGVNSAEAPVKKDFLNPGGLSMEEELFEDRRIPANAVALALP